MTRRIEKAPPTSRRDLYKAGGYAFLSMLVVAFAVTAAAAQTLTISGSTTFATSIMGPHQKAIEAATGLKLVIIPNKTDLGVKLLAEKRADVAMISTALEPVLRVLRETEPDLPLNRLKSFEVYSAKVAFTVHPSNPVRSASAAQLRKVLLGEITNWKDLGGPDLPIRIVRVDSGAGIPLTLETQLLDGKPIAAKDPIRVRISSQVAKVVEQEPGALGLTQTGNLPGRKVAVITTDKQFEQQLSYVTFGDPSAPVKSLIEATRKIVLQSE
jgi:phosphate transport system substrate-binding protein